MLSWPEAPIDFRIDAAEASEIFSRVEAVHNIDPVPLLERLMVILDRGDGLPGLAFDRYRKDARQQAVVVPDLPTGTEIWVVGDVHGDILALDAALAHIDKSSDGSSDPIVLFLGDLVDDNPDGAAVVVRVIQRILARPERVAVLAGNHDEALSCDVEGRFSSSVDPCEFKDWLNRDGRSEGDVALGKAFIRLFASAPRSVFFSDGLFAAHGGVPHTDLIESITCADDLGRADCLTDFVWTRAHSKAPKKIPNRSTRGCQFGVRDFEAFCEVASKVVGWPITGMLRGHDHVEARFDLLPAYRKYRMLTVNTLSRPLPREFGVIRPTPCVIRHCIGESIEVHRLWIDGVVEDDANLTPVKA